MWHRADALARPPFWRQRVRALPIETDAAGHGVEFTGQRLQQRRLAGTVATKDGDGARGRDRHGKAEQNLTATVTSAQVVHLQDGIMNRVRHGWYRSPGRVDPALSHRWCRSR